MSAQLEARRQEAQRELEEVNTGVFMALGGAALTSISIAGEIVSQLEHSPTGAVASVLGILFGFSLALGGRTSIIEHARLHGQRCAEVGSLQNG